MSVLKFGKFVKLAAIIVMYSGMSALALAVAQSKGSSSGKEVVVIGTVHGDHNRFPLYNFQTLEIVLKHISPDLLLIEEDPKTFNDKLYEKLSEEEYNKIRPIEIRKVIMPFAKTNGVKVIPTDWRVEFDPASEKQEAEITALLKDKSNRKKFESMILSYESLFIDEYLFRSIYDLHSDTMMAILEQREKLFDGTPFEKLRTLDRKRQDRINANVVKALENENFKKAVVIYGISHRPPLVRAIKKSGAAHLLPLQKAMKSKIPGFFEREEALTLPE